MKNIEELIERQEKVLKELQAARRKECEAYLAHQQADDDLTRATRDEIMKIVSSPKYQELVTASGELHESWSKWLLDKELEKSEKFINALEKVYITQETYAHGKARVANAKDELDVVNVRLEVLKSYG